MTGHTCEDLEVVWPLHRSHILSPMLTDEDIVMHPEPEPSEPTLAACVDAVDHGRALAVRALLAGAECLQQRVSDLLGVSRRTIGRMADADLSATLRDPQALEGARTCLADTVRHGSTAEEREAAVTWLQQAARNEDHVAGVQALRRAASRTERLATAASWVSVRRTARRPSFVPCAFARASPALTRSTIRPRSNSAIAPRMCMRNQVLQLPSQAIELPSHQHVKLPASGVLRFLLE